MALSPGISLTQKGGLSKGVALSAPPKQKSAPASKPAPAANTPVVPDPNYGTVPVGGYNPAQMALMKKQNLAKKIA